MILIKYCSDFGHEKSFFYFYFSEPLNSQTGSWVLGFPLPTGFGTIDANILALFEGLVEAAKLGVGNTILEGDWAFAFT